MTEITNQDINDLCTVSACLPAVSYIYKALLVSAVSVRDQTRVAAAALSYSSLIGLSVVL